jgi:TM2 domain-containing membrane protein YozV
MVRTPANYTWCLALLFLLCCSGLAAKNQQRTGKMNSCSSNNTILLCQERVNPLPMPNRFLKRMEDNRRIIAACLAFPLPAGFLGAHRIFLGTSPYIPVVYMATLGGCLGIIPLVDFFVIIFTKDLDKYINNPKAFMWMK